MRADVGFMYGEEACAYEGYLSVACMCVCVRMLRVFMEGVCANEEVNDMRAFVGVCEQGGMGVCGSDCLGRGCVYLRK